MDMPVTMVWLLALAEVAGDALLKAPSSRVSGRAIPYVAGGIFPVI